MNTLYLVPTPLGDPDDITLRALRILRDVSAIAAPDDAIEIRKLLDDWQISTQIISYGNAIEALDDGDVALIGTGGTPGIGDAAQVVIREAIERGIRVDPLPGASAEITALVLSGLATDAFVYAGALPEDLSGYAHERETMIFRVGELTGEIAGGRGGAHDGRGVPHPYDRQADAESLIVLALERVYAAFGERRIAVARSLTQPNEIVFRGTITEAKAYFREASGGALLVVEGAPPEVQEVWDEARVRIVLREHLRQGMPLKEAAKEIARMAGWDRRAVYALGVDEKRNRP